MARYEIFNVGQGDCIFIRPCKECDFNNELMIIDLGEGNKDITSNIKSSDRVHIFLTHHDIDHTGGFRYFIGDKFKQIKEITLPLYQNEITLIARTLLGIKGVRSAKVAAGLVKDLEDIISNQMYLKNIVEREFEGPEVTFAYQGKYFCNHIQCLNPPLQYSGIDWLGAMEEHDIEELLSDLFDYDTARALKVYFVMAKSSGQQRFRNSNDYIRRYDSQIIESIYIHENKQLEDDYNGENISEYAKANYVMRFIQSNLLLIKEISNNSNKKNITKIYDNFIKTTHDACMVLRFDYDNRPMLASGDATKGVFRRLIDEKQVISAYYFKMPHHGSNKNINKKILQEINPNVAIISHNNRFFGKAKDSHPNIEVIEMLQKENIKIVVTNDVIKNNVPIVNKKDNLDDKMIKVID